MSCHKIVGNSAFTAVMDMNFPGFKGKTWTKREWNALQMCFHGELDKYCEILRIFKDL